MAGHAGGPAIDGALTERTLPDAVELAMDEAGLQTAHFVGNSLGGYVALALAARGRAESVVALAPAGGWARGDESYRDLLAFQRDVHLQARAAVPHTQTLLGSAQGRRAATQFITTNFEHIPIPLLAHQLRGVASCPAAERMIAFGLSHDWTLQAAHIGCPVRVVWGTGDRLLPWPQAAARYRTEWLPQADWVVLDDIGHCPQLDVPLEAGQLILGFTAP
jgi:pimeloyl-ACP methyl ester carboxylesterase